MNVQVGDPRDLALCFGVFADVRAVQVWSVEEAIVGALWSVRRFASWRRGLAGLRSESPFHSARYEWIFRLRGRGTLCQGVGYFL